MTDRVVRAGLWNGALRSVLRSVGFIRNVVLARILAPDDVGLFGMALVVLSIIERFSNTGLTAALVQRKESVDQYLNSAWTIQVARGIALGSLLLLTAPLAATFFDEQAVAPLIRVLAIAVLVRSVKNPGIVQLQRELDVRRQFMIRFGGASADLLVSIVASVVLRSAWGLMLGLVAGSTTNLVLSYRLHPFRPRPRLDMSVVRALSRFGLWVFLNDVLFFLAYRGDNLIVGKVLGSVALGAYILAYSVSEVVTVEVSRTFAEVGFPAYARIQDQAERLRRGFRLGLEIVTSVTLPAAVVLFLLAEPIVNVVFGPRWAAVAIALPPLAVAGAIRSLLAPASAAFNALGRPNHTFRMNVVAVLVTYALMIPLIQRAGLPGVGWAVASGLAVTIPVAYASTRQLLGIPVGMMIRTLVPALGLGAGVAMPLLVAGPVASDRIVAGLAFRISIAAMGYAAATAALWWGFRRGPVAFRQVIVGATRTAASRKAPAIELQSAATMKPLERVTQGD